MTARILVVDDQRANVEMMAGVLRARGYEVLIAQDGVTALERVHAGLPDVVVSDILMPGMDGYELCRHLKGDPALSGVPVIVLTTSAAPADIQAAYGLHANAFVTKPADLFATMAAMERLGARAVLHGEPGAAQPRVGGREADLRAVGGPRAGHPGAAGRHAGDAAAGPALHRRRPAARRDGRGSPRSRRAAPGVPWGYPCQTGSPFPH